MNKKALYIVFLLIGGLNANAQMQFSGYNTQGWTSMDNYNNKTLNGGITIIVESVSPHNAANIPNWRISARVINQAAAANGKFFPIDKISIQPNYTAGTVNPHPVPSISQIGFYPNVNLSTTEQDLVTSSLTPIVLNTPGQPLRWEFWYNWTIQGGAYLSQLQAWQVYSFSVEYRLFGSNGQPMGNTVVLNHQIQVNQLSGSPPVQNNFSLTVNGGAKNGTLTLQSRQHYDTGTSVTYDNGLTVNTNAAYQVTVNASPGTPHFSYGNNNIDLDVLNVKLATVASGVTNLNQVTLSTGAQVIAKGGSTSNQNVNFDVGYSINLANKDKLLYAFKDKQQTETTYTTTLQYTILAQ